MNGGGGGGPSESSPFTPAVRSSPHPTSIDAFGGGSLPVPAVSTADAHTDPSHDTAPNAGLNGDPNVRVSAGAGDGSAGSHDTKHFTPGPASAASVPTNVERSPSPAPIPTAAASNNRTPAPAPPVSAKSGTSVSLFSYAHTLHDAPSEPVHSEPSSHPDVQYASSAGTITAPGGVVGPTPGRPDKPVTEGQPPTPIIPSLRPPQTLQSPPPPPPPASDHGSASRNGAPPPTASRQ